MRTSTLALLAGVALTRADFLNPASGETLEVDEEFTIQWETEGLVEPIDISLVPADGDAGVEAQEVASGIGNTGSVAFTPDVEAGDFELILTDSENNTVVSDAFSIANAGAVEDGEGEADGGVTVEEASDAPASQAGGLDQVTNANDGDEGEDPDAGPQQQDDSAPPVVESTEDDEAEGSDLLPEQGDGGVPAADEPSDASELENGETAVEDEETAVEDGETEVEDGETEVEDGEAEVEDEDENEDSVSLNPGTGGAVTGDAGDDGSNAGDAGGPPGSFIPLSGDQLTIFPTLTIGAGADAPSQPTEEEIDAIETSAVDGDAQTVPNGLSETEPAEPTVIASVSDDLAVSTSATDVGSEVTSAVVDGDIAQTDALELEPTSSTTVTTDAAVGSNPIGVPGAEITSTASDEASLDSDSDSSTDTALTSDVTGVSSIINGTISDDPLSATSDPLQSASTADPLASASASDLLSSTATDDALVSASDLTGAGSDTEAQTATTDGSLASTGDEVSATLTDEDGSPVSSTIVSTATGDVPTPVGSGDSDDSERDDEDLDSDDGDLDSEDEGEDTESDSDGDSDSEDEGEDTESDSDGDSDSEGEGEDTESDSDGDSDSEGKEPDSDINDPDTESDSDTSGASDPTTFTTNIIGTGTITDGAAEATVSRVGANAGEDVGEAEDSPGGSAGKISGKSAMLGLVVLVSIWMF